MRAFKWVGTCLLLAGLGSGCGFRIGGPNYGDTIDGIGCDRSANVSFQATIYLWLVTDAGREGPTEGVGSTGSECNYWVRTEGDAGVIHIRAPQPVSPSLETFFRIWDLAIPRGSGNSAPFRDAAEHGQILVDGEQVTGGASAVTLRDGATIELIAPRSAGGGS